MFDSIVTPIIVLLAAGLLIYRFQLFHKKALWHMSLHQIFLLVVVPGLLLPQVFSYLDSLRSTPLRSQVIFSDSLLINIILLSLFYAYGGVAIHSVTKMFSQPDLLRHDTGEAGELNRYYHLAFSHSLMFAGPLVTMLGISLMEINHIPQSDPTSIVSGVMKGLVVGLLFFFVMKNYTRYLYEGDEYKGKWSDLKIVFVVAWVGFMMILYSIRKLDPRVTDYQLLLPAMFSFAILGFVNIFLVFRRLKQGGWRVIVRWKRLQRIFATSN